MAFKYVLLSFCALVGVASAGFLAPATTYAAASIPVVAKVAQPHYDAVGTTQQNVVRSFGGTVSTYSKNVVTPYSSVSKVDSRITNNVYTPKTLYSAPAPVITKSFYAAAPAPVVAKTVYSAPVAKAVYARGQHKLEQEQHKLEQEQSTRSWPQLGRQEHKPELERNKRAWPQLEQERSKQSWPELELEQQRTQSSQQRELEHGPESWTQWE